LFNSKNGENESHENEYIKPNNLVDSIQQYVVDQIRMNRWKQGDRIDELLIVNELNVSRNSVREALSRLAALHALEKRHWSGYYIPVITREQADLTLQVRILLEKYAMELFMPRITAQLITEIENAVNQSEDAINNNDYYAFNKYDVVIHTIIKENCGNPWLAHFLDQIRFVLVLLMQMEETEDRVIRFTRNSVVEHRKIIEAMKQRNANQAVELIVQHLEYHRARIEKIFIECSHQAQTSSADKEP